MSKKRYIDTRFWSDTWVMDNLKPLERYVYIYLLTNDKTNVAGVYEIGLKTMINELDLQKSEIVAILNKIKTKVIYRDGWVVIRNAIKHQNYKNTKIEAGIIAALQKAPQSLLELVHVPKDAFEIINHLKQYSTPVNQLDIYGSSMTPEDLSHSDLDSDIDIDSDASSHKFKISKNQKPKPKDQPASQNSPAYIKFKQQRKALNL